MILYIISVLIITVYKSVGILIVVPLTNRQTQIYEFIASWQMNKGAPPTQAEIRDHFNFGSLNAVRSHLVLIEKKGYIKLNFGKARGIQLMPSPAKATHRQDGHIPLLGDIAAGVPIWAIQNFEDYLPIPPSLFGGGELFALRISGDSMNRAGIYNGDIAIIKRQANIENGEIAAVLIEQEATLKRVYFSPNSLVLRAENPAFKDLNYSIDKSDSILIMGRYIGIIRIGTHRGRS
jgi:repressor LexA